MRQQRMSWKRFGFRGSILVLAAALVTACSGQSDSDIRFEPFQAPPASASYAPRLSVDDEGALWLSWLEEVGDSEHALRFARHDGEDWSAVRTVATGPDWFANWADTPGVRPVGDWLFAHWLVRSGPGTYDYDIRAAWSRDQGETWSEPFTLHADSRPTEHGFVSSTILANGHLGLAWLDGRTTVADQGSGAMSLRWAEFEPGSDRPVRREELDERVCDCCMTATVTELDGPRIIYRDRSRNEIRDIAHVTPDRAGEGRTDFVGRDDWRIAACPVNGPDAARIDGHTGVLWFTAADSPRVRLAWKSDDAAGFSRPQRIDDGSGAGRVALVELGGQEVLAVWLRAAPEGGAWMARRVRPDELARPVRLTAASAGRGSGFPALVRTSHGVIMAWTEFRDGQRRVRTARLDPE